MIIGSAIYSKRELRSLRKRLLRQLEVIDSALAATNGTVSSAGIATVHVHAADSKSLWRFLDNGGKQLIDAASRKLQQDRMSEAFRSATETHRWRAID